MLELVADGRCGPKQMLSPACYQLAWRERSLEMTERSLAKKQELVLKIKKQDNLFHLDRRVIKQA